VTSFALERPWAHWTAGLRELVEQTDIVMRQ